MCVCVCGRRFLPDASSSTCKYFIMSQWRGRWEQKILAGSPLFRSRFSPTHTNVDPFSICCYRDVMSHWNMTPRIHSVLIIWTYRLDFVLVGFIYLFLFYFISFCIWRHSNKFSCGWQFNPIQFSTFLYLFSTRLRQMWLDLELSCSYGKVCFTQTDCLISFGHFGTLVNVHVWAIISISHSSNPPRTQSPSTFGSCPLGSNQVSPLNPLPPLLSH